MTDTEILSRLDRREDEPMSEAEFAFLRDAIIAKVRSAPTVVMFAAELRCSEEEALTALERAEARGQVGRIAFEGEERWVLLRADERSAR